MIDPKKIDEIRDKADIVAVISEYVPLKKRGKNFLGSCPFHSEKQPSFTVSPEKRLFHCFGCGEGGNVFSFIMKIENVDFARSVEMIGSKLGITVEGVTGSSKDHTEKDKLFEALKLAASYFSLNLSDEKAKEYLKTRGINEETLNTFKIGYALNNWDGLFKFLIGKGVHPTIIEKAGLILKREQEEGYYDRFRNRLIFPIYDIRSRVVGFGGRNLGPEEPKYLNSPDTPVYSKGEILYGLSITKQEVRENKKIVLVEGYMDCVTCYQAGIKFVAATLGTALTNGHAKLLKRFAEEVVLAFDSDIAGEAAKEKSAEILRNLDLNIKVLEITGAKDPDEFIKNNGAEAFKTLIDNALPWVEYKLKRIIARHNISEIEGKAKAATEIASFLSGEKNQVIRDEYVKLAANELKIDKELILSEIRRIASYNKAKPSRYGLSRTIEKPQSKIIQAEECLIKLAFESDDAFNKLKENLGAEYFTEQPLQEIIKIMFGSNDVPVAELPQRIMEGLSEDSQKILSKLLLSPELPGEKDEVFLDCVNTLKEHHLKSRFEAIKKELHEKERSGDLDKVNVLHKEFVELDGILRSYKKIS